MFIVIFFSDNSGLSHNEHVQNCWHQWSRTGWRYEYLFWWHLAIDIPVKSTKQAKLIRLSERDLFEVNCKYQLLDMLELVSKLTYEMSNDNFFTQGIISTKQLQAIHRNTFITAFKYVIGFPPYAFGCWSCRRVYFYHQQYSKDFHNDLNIMEILWMLVLRSSGWGTVHVCLFPLIPNSCCCCRSTGLGRRDRWRNIWFACQQSAILISELPVVRESNFHNKISTSMDEIISFTAFKKASSGNKLTRTNILKSALSFQDCYYQLLLDYFGKYSDNLLNTGERHILGN